MFIRAKYVLQFSRGKDLQNTGFDLAIDNCRLARRKEAFHKITDFTSLHVVTRNNRCNFFSMLAVKFFG